MDTEKKEKELGNIFESIPDSIDELVFNNNNINIQE
jgi:hypothetical protein